MRNESIFNSIKENYYLNSTKSVGPLMQHINKLKPQSLEEWEKYYFKNVRSISQIEAIGKKLFEYIPEDEKTFRNISIKECIDYMINLVIFRTYKGYVSESIVKKELSAILGVNVNNALSKYDAKYHLDLEINYKNKSIYIQVKPDTYYYTDIPYDIKKAHKEFLSIYPNSIIMVIRYKKIDDNNIELYQQDVEELKKIMK